MSKGAPHTMFDLTNKPSNGHKYINWEESIENLQVPMAYCPKINDVKTVVMTSTGDKCGHCGQSIN